MKVIFFYFHFNTIYFFIVLAGTTFTFARLLDLPTYVAFFRWVAHICWEINMLYISPKTFTVLFLMVTHEHLPHCAAKFNQFLPGGERMQRGCQTSLPVRNVYLTAEGISRSGFCFAWKENKWKSQQAAENSITLNAIKVWEYQYMCFYFAVPLQRNGYTSARSQRVLGNVHKYRLGVDAIFSALGIWAVK